MGSQLQSNCFIAVEGNCVLMNLSLFSVFVSGASKAEVCPQVWNKASS